MSPIRWVGSSLIAWHLLALSVRALPPLELLSSSAPPAEWSSARGTLLTPALDRLASWVERAARHLHTFTAPVSTAADRYVRSLGFAQQWRMFSTPPTNAQYVRLRYYVSGGREPEWAATELVVPAHREDRVRLLEGFFDSTRDKAIMVALENFHRLRAPEAHRKDTRPSELPDYLAPVVRHFARRFAAQGLLASERVVRVEFWYGVAPMSRPGAAVEAQLRASRSETLSRYYDGPVESRPPELPYPYPPYLSRSQEGDITWILDYYEEE